MVWGLNHQDKRWGKKEKQRGDQICLRSYSKPLVKLTLEPALGNPAPVSGHAARAMVCLGQPNQVDVHDLQLSLMERLKMMFCFNICRRIIDPGRHIITHVLDNSSMIKPCWGFTKMNYELVIYPCSHKICANSISTEILCTNPMAITKESCIPALPCFPDMKPSLLAYLCWSIRFTSAWTWCSYWKQWIK